MGTLLRRGLWYCGLFKEAAGLDIFDLAPEFSSEAFNLLSLGDANLPRKGVVTRICIFFWHLFGSLKRAIREERSPIPPQAFVFFVMVRNERESLKPVWARLPNAHMAGQGLESNQRFPYFWAYVLAIFYFPVVATQFLKASGYRKRSFAYIFDHYWFIYGLFIVSRAWLNRLKPGALILANHLSIQHRVMLRAARDEHLPTFYLQHASISDRSLALDVDYALLEGRDALDKFVRAGTTVPQVFLVGIPKQDPFFQHINKMEKVHSIGICTNGMDPIVRAEELCGEIRKSFPDVPLILRPHDADPRVSEWKRLSDKYGMRFSDSKSELPLDFLKTVEAVIAGDSSILLEAALMNVFPLYYDFAQAHLDWYGFERNGLVEYLSEPIKVCRVISEISQHKPSVRSKAKLYCNTIGTRYDGHASELASGLIQELVSGKPNLDQWKRIENPGLEAYEPAGS